MGFCEHGRFERLRQLAHRLRPLAQMEHPRDVIRQFTPNWFAATMGTGILAQALPQVPGAGSMHQMTAVWLLPVVAAEVAAASGGLLAPCLTSGHEKLVTLLASFVLWAYSVPVAFAILTILILRMALHKLPHASMAASSWLALGPIGAGILGMLFLGADSPAILAAPDLADVGRVAAGLGVVAAILLWGFGLWWLLLAWLVAFRYFRAVVPFNLGWWGYIFPLGVYAVATLKLGALFGLAFFSSFGAILVIALATMWGLVAGRTIHGAWRGHLFVSPCLASAN